MLFIEITMFFCFDKFNIFIKNDNFLWLSLYSVFWSFCSISCLPDLAEIADLSSISCSPAHHQDWVESAEAPPIPHSRGHPPCNSTPRSPKGKVLNQKNEDLGYVVWVSFV